MNYSVVQQPLYMKDIRILISAALYAFFATINQTAVLFFGYDYFYVYIEKISSVFGLVCFAYLMFVVYKLLVKNDKKVSAEYGTN